MDWGTPQPLFDKYNDEFDFDLDAAATFANTKCQRFIGPPGYKPYHQVLMRGPKTCVGGDALAPGEWLGSRIWLNPPYGRELKKWYNQVVWQAVHYKKLVVMLAPSRTDTAYWHDYVWNAAERAPRPWVDRIDFLKGRIKFEGAEHGAPFPSAVIVFRDF